jgi:hypothetical protein
MSRGIRLLTGALLAIPVVFLALSWLVTALSVFAAVAAALVALYAAIWLWWRPSGFDVGPSGLVIRFPAATRSVPATRIAGVRTLTAPELYAEVGLALRVGVGGLWGGFGWLWTQRRGFVEFYVSRLDGLVWIERRDARPLLVTPSDPAGFAAALAPSARRAETARGLESLPDPGSPT